MVKIAAIIAAVLVYLGFQTKAKADADVPTEYLPAGSVAGEPYIPIDIEVQTMSMLDTLYQKHGRLRNLDWRLLKAIAQVESSENPQAKNPSDPSYGLMQILCRPDGHGGCSNNLNVLGWPPMTVHSLYDPDYSLHIGAQILEWNIGRYGFLRGIACYNHWGARLSEPDGPFPNQKYVDKVMGKYNSLSHVGSF